MNTKKFLAIFLSVLMLLSYASFGAEAEEENNASDERAAATVSSEAAWEAVDVLSGLGIIPSAQAIPEGNITRGDFAVLLLSLLHSEYIQTRDTGYRDVSGGGKDYHAIGFMVEIGAMSGSRGLFRPNDAITLNDAVRALLTVLGYARAEMTDAACMNRANSLSLFSGIHVSNNGSLGTDAAYRMIFNALFVEYLGVSELKGQQILYAEKGSVLWRFYDIVEIIGVVTQTQQTGLYTKDGYSGGVAIDGVRYATETDWNTYLGYRVTAYVRRDGGRQLVYMRPQPKNKVVTLETMDIERLENKETLYYYSDEKQERTEKIKLKGSVPVVMNGQNAGSVSDFSTQELILKNEQGQAESAQLTLVDNNDDGVCDLIMLWRFKTFYVTKSDTTKGFFRDKYRNDSLNLSDYDEDSVHIYTDGEPGAKTDFRVGVVLNLAETADGSSVTIYASTTQLYDETVTAVEENRLKIGDNWYEKSSYYNSYFDGGTTVEKPYQIKVGAMGIFYLDHMGRVVFAKQSSVYQYGYMTNVKKDTGLSEVYRARMFVYDTESGESGFQTFTFAAQTQIDGTAYKGSQLKNNAVLFPGQIFAPQLVKYKLNANGELSQLLLANTEHTITSLDFALTDHWYATTGFELNFQGSARYSTNAKSLGNRFYCSDSSTVFVVPTDVTDESGFAKASYSSVFVNGKTYNVEIYDVGRDTYSGIIVYRSASGVASSYSSGRSLFVQDVVTTVDDEGNEVQKITGYGFESETWLKFKNSSVTYFTASDFVLVDSSGAPAGNIQKGDVIRYNKNAQDKLKDARLEFRYSEGLQAFRNEEITSGKTYNFDGDYGASIYGKMAFYEAGKSVIGISFDEGQTFITYAKSGTDYTPYIVYDTKRGTTTIEADLNIITCLQNPQEATKIYAISFYGNLTFAVIYK